MSMPSSLNPTTLSRAQGCLLGQLAGDSLGGLVEFQSPEDIRRKYPDGVRELADGGTWGTLAGQPTDDSEMALMLARMLVRLRRYDSEEARKAFNICNYRILLVPKLHIVNVQTTTLALATKIRHAALPGIRHPISPAHIIDFPSPTEIRLHPIGQRRHGIHLHKFSAA